MENECTTLKKICDELSDGLHKAPIFNAKGEYLFVNALNLQNGFIVDNNDGKRADESEFKKYKIDLNENTILYSIDGTIGNIAKYRGEKCILGKGACYLKVNSHYNADYIYYVLQSPHFQNYIRTMSTGSTIHHISLQTMRNYSFYLPIREKQDAIATILKSLDEKISINKKINATLEDMAKTLYDYWFVQFDFPDDNGKPYKSSGGKMIFNQELGREIPASWEVKKLGEISQCELGGTPDRSNLKFWNGNISWINSSSVNKFRIIESDEKITAEGLKNSSAKLLPPKTTVIAITGATLGKISLLEINSCTNQSVVGIIQNPKFPYEYIYPTLKNNISALITGVS